MSGLTDWSGSRGLFGGRFGRRALSVLVIAGAVYLSYRAARYFMSSRSRKAAAAAAAADSDAAGSASGRARSPRVPATLDEAFTAATELVRRRPIAADETDLLELYALFKMATVGRCTAPKPSAFDFQRVAMWTAWSNMREIPPEDAKRAYLEALSVLLPRWQRSARVRFPGRRYGGPPVEGDQPVSVEHPAPGADTDDEAAAGGEPGAERDDDAEEEPFAPVDYDVFEEAIAEAERLDAARGAAYGEENASGEKPGRGRMGPVFSGGFSLEDDVPAPAPAPASAAAAAAAATPAPEPTPASARAAAPALPVAAVASAPSLTLPGASSGASIARPHAAGDDSGNASGSDTSADLLNDSVAPSGAPTPSGLQARALVRSEAGDRDDDAAFEEARSVSSSAVTATPGADGAAPAALAPPARGVPGPGSSEDMRTLVSGGAPALETHFAAFSSPASAAEGAQERDERGRTLLHHAADAGDADAIAAVLAAIVKAAADADAAGAAARAPDVEGLSPLHYAIFAGEAEAVQALIAAGADTHGGCRMDPLGPFARMAAGAFGFDVAAAKGSDGRGLTARECAVLVGDEDVLAALGE